MKFYIIIFTYSEVLVEKLIFFIAKERYRKRTLKNQENILKRFL